MCGVVRAGLDLYAQDLTDPVRMALARQLVDEALVGAAGQLPVIVLGNKSDNPGACSREAAAAALNLAAGGASSWRYEVRARLCVL